MALKISPEVLDEIRFEANYETYDGILMKIDPDRFRGLGEENREAFIRHATTCCDGWEIPYIDDVAYIMFVMTYLGSFFHEDPRHSFIGVVLPDIPEAADYRIRDLRDRFIAFGDRFIGEGLELYHQDLDQFRQSLLPDLDRHSASRTLSMVTRCHGERSYDLSREDHAARMQQAEIGAHRLGLEGDRGLQLSVLLGYWLGSGFWKDPLYPWIPEKAAKGGEPELRKYAIHRLNKDLMNG
ncbi:MAG: hypothetical protein M9924_14870 [Rhizobiaceae bacterium]|nr:hypothetical protein [Rhizobiaceae bacterium]